MIRTFTDAVKFLGKYIPTPEKKHPGSLGLGRMQELVIRLGNPQLQYSTIHVGGTSGKGSTATIIASILSQKYKVGLHTSPHLVRINERIKIIGRHSGDPPAGGDSRISKRSWTHLAGGRASQDDISEADFVELVNEVRPRIETMAITKLGPPSYFEIVTAMAFLAFAKANVDIAVIEVGMGGRFDATNIIKPLVAVLTNVGLDHTEILGNTVEKIASDKVGIIKPGISVVTGVKKTSINQLIKVKCKQEKARLSILNKDFRYSIKEISEKGCIFDYDGKNTYKDLHLSLLGAYQIENASLAIRAIEEIFVIPTKRKRVEGSHIDISEKRFLDGVYPERSQGARNDQLSEQDIRDGLKSAFIPGRLEIIQRNPTVVLDGAHNPDKIRALSIAIKTIFPKKRIIGIVAIKSDKNAKEILQELLSLCDELLFTKFQLQSDIGIISSYNPEELLKIAKSLERKKRMTILKSAGEAVQQAINDSKEDDVILVTGSLYLVGELYSYFFAYLKK